MPVDLRRIVPVAAGLSALQLLVLAGTAAAAPGPISPSPSASPKDCKGLFGMAAQACQAGQNTNTSGSLPGSIDPVQSLANSCANAAAWIVRKLSDGIDSTTNVDFTNSAFLKQYAIVFAAATFLTLLLWLLAVIKRAARGVPLHTAFGEAIGYLWLTVLASAFTPLILYTVVSATDGITQGIAAGTKTDTATYLGTFADTLTSGKIGGGPIILVLVSLIAIVAAAMVWLEMFVRAAMLYVGALLGTVVYAGMVDKQLWKHVRRWAGLMIAVILVKPVIVIVLGLAGAVASSAGANDAFATVTSGVAILVLSIFASSVIYRFVPGFGDDMVAMRRARAQAVSAGRAVVNGPANFMKQGISTHAGRDGENGGGSGGAAAGGGSVTPGIAAHATRNAPAPAAPPAQGGSPDATRSTSTTSTFAKGGGSQP
ncbi:hypothetical protein [Streptacidiphilus jiangxiensis]|uniref:TrbL/VirB6 plasmid conjugal transfer protein n=1 Tax=Streptacidiphilus jiangxiensis TaxID=235985 RepID=A0A1H7XZ44_STRJI|nr:hypothetical protein [Streptacidiphilus jiangxiensis]SEM38971.1 hypothetical protein SAMN05414137_1266 [Streptacidiphilus jiangxiensis]